MSEGYFTGIFKIVLACGYAERKREREREGGEEKKRKKGKRKLFRRRGDSSSRFAKIPKRASRNCFITCGCLWRAKGKTRIERSWNKYIVTSEGSSFILVIYTRIVYSRYYFLKIIRIDVIHVILCNCAMCSKNCYAS